MKVLLIGGHGKVALLTAPLLVEQGDEVISMIRKAEQSPEVASTGARPLVADVTAMSTEELTELSRGFDAVIWSAGAGGGAPERTYAVDRDAAIRSIDAAEAADVKRYVMVSYYGAGPDHGVPSDNGFYHYAEAKAAADEHLRGTGLAWTIVAPSRLTLDAPTGRIALKEAGADGSTPTARANVAAVIAAVLNDDSTVHKMLEFTDGDAEIASALAE